MDGFQVLKGIAARLPETWNEELKRLHFRRQIRKGNFVTGEPESEILDRFIRAGDWVIDIGANVGQYTAEFSGLVGPQGRVLAFEPVPQTFALLAANCRHFEHQNVSLFNAAVSDKTGSTNITIPEMNGASNFYLAFLGDSGNMSVMTLSIDSLAIERKLSLVKIDAEGHEVPIVRGMLNMLKRDRPTLIIEKNDGVEEFLHPLGYQSSILERSPNVIYRPT